MSARPEPRRQVLLRQGRALVAAIRENDEAAVEDAVVALSRSHRIFAPLVFALGAFAMLFQGLRTLFFNWRLTLIQVLPAMWIWLALLDLKAHTFRGKEFHAWHGGVELLLVLGITVVTAACFYLNAVFAFAISHPGRPTIRPAFARARRHLAVVLGVGLVVGVAFGVSAIVVPRWGRLWFALSLGIVIGVMMLTYVTVPARIVGIKPVGSRRDKLAAAAIGGTVGAVVCAPAYVIGRIGILLLGSSALFPLAVVLLVIGFALEAGATGAVKAVKMSAKLAAGHSAVPKAPVT
jgi:magnesium-transporting ATPase (P-type)